MEFELSELDKKMNAIITDYENRIIEFANRSCATKTAIETRKLEKARNFELIRLFKNVLLNIELYEAIQ